jgi:hypothetical protein
VDGASQTYIELWFDGVNITDDFARQGLGQRLRDGEGEEEWEEEFEFEPCISRVTAINNFRVTLLNHRLLFHIREFVFQVFRDSCAWVNQSVCDIVPTYV